MKSTSCMCLGVALAALSVNACKPYRGAVYSSYEEAGVGIKTTAESSAPVKVHFGYDRAIAALVPRRGGGAEAEEATSIISRDDVRATVVPTQISQNPVLQVDSAFITGTAAIVAAAPTDTTVVVKAPGKDVQLQTKGGPGTRIATALASAPRLSDAEVGLDAVIEATSRRRSKAAVYRRAAQLSPAPFRTLYEAKYDGSDPEAAFRSATFDYLDAVDDDTARAGELIDALRSANQEVN